MGVRSYFSACKWTEFPIEFDYARYLMRKGISGTGYVIVRKMDAGIFRNVIFR